MIHWMATVPWIVLVLVLLWRVVRLEGVQRDVYDNMRQMLKLNDIGRASEVDVLRAENRLHECLNKDRSKMHAIARALGYEWKRTEAKEGWERKQEPFSFGVTTAQYVAKNLNRLDWEELGKDRRKGDRRKPTIAKAADDPFPSPLDRVVTRKKKPRRAH